MKYKVIFLSNFITQLFDKQAPNTTVQVTKPKARWFTDTFREMIKTFFVLL